MSAGLQLLLLRGLLGFLAGYHLMIGLASVLSLPATASITRQLYAIELNPGAQFGYAVKMLGLYALVFGGLLAVAAWRPHQSGAVIAGVVVLQFMRAIARAWNAALLTEAFRVSRSRNAAHAALLVAEAVALAVLARPIWFAP